MIRRTGQALALAAATAAYAAVVVAAPLARAEGNPPPATFVPAIPGPAAGTPLMMDDNKAQPAAIPSRTAATGPTSPMEPAGVGPTTSESAPVTVNPLMGLLSIGGPGSVGDSLQKANISVYGWVEGSWTYDATNTPDRLIAGRQFDTRNKSIQLDQVDITVTRPVDYTKAFDVGFTVENMYGWDAAYIHSNGLTYVGPGRTASPFPGTGGTLHVSPHAQYDLTQANATLSSNALGGIGLEFGKFNTLLGYEVIDAYSPAGGTQNALFSRSYIFVQEPFTHTGVLLQYNGIKNVAVQGGVTRGWDQATDDDNGQIDYTAQVKYTSADSSSFIALSGITGNEEPRGPQDGWRTVIDLTAQHKFGDRLALGLNAMYAWEAQTGNGGLPGGIGQWYGVAAYASYDLVPRKVQLNVRGEWFNDPDGAAPTQFNVSLPSAPAYQRVVGRPNAYYEVTAGATIHPFSEDKYLSGFSIRPEVRLDYADHATWAGGTKNYQLTATLEATYAF